MNPFKKVAKIAVAIVTAPVKIVAAVVLLGKFKDK